MASSRSASNCSPELGPRLCVRVREGDALLPFVKIEIGSSGLGEGAYFNVDNVVSVHPGTSGGSLLYVVGRPQPIETRTSPDEIQRRITRGSR